MSLTTQSWTKDCGNARASLTLYNNGYTYLHLGGVSTSQGIYNLLSNTVHKFEYSL